EGLGIGWVSILEPHWLKSTLRIPEQIEIIALLCIGKAEEFPDEPMLQTVGWRPRDVLETRTHSETWGHAYPWRKIITSLNEIVARIEPLHTAMMDQAQRRLDSLTKPQGSLGRLEELAKWLAGVTGQSRPALARKVVFTFAADHGVAAEGVSAY